MSAEPVCRLNLFAKAPLPGLVKTRLAEQVGDACAASLAGCFIEATLEVAVAHWPGPVQSGMEASSGTWVWG